MSQAESRSRVGGEAEGLASPLWQGQHSWTLSQTRGLGWRCGDEAGDPSSSRVPASRPEDSQVQSRSLECVARSCPWSCPTAPTSPS